MVKMALAAYPVLQELDDRAPRPGRAPARGKVVADLI